MKLLEGILTSPRQSLSLLPKRVAPGAGIRSRVAIFVKELLDRLLAAITLVFLCPILLMIALLIRVHSPGPVLYRRRVVGLNGIEFDAFKFRTMVIDAEPILRRYPELHKQYSRNMKLRQDPRVHRLGAFLRKTSLDELPQLFNVIFGQMSLVGPRIISLEEVPRYGEQLMKRLSVKPGITGLWQVSGRQELDYSKRIELDLYYVDNWCLMLDFAILLKTFPTVLSMRGAY
jgi:lipopolysaccharide/colanic/teichoic acid biosynthesis glycosyltransferase